MTGFGDRSATSSPTAGGSACPSTIWSSRAAHAVRAGVDVIQVRERDLPDGELTALVRRIVAWPPATKTRVMVNDRADVAIAAGAAGVHLRGDSAPASRVRACSRPKGS